MTKRPCSTRSKSYYDYFSTNLKKMLSQLRENVRKCWKPWKSYVDHLWFTFTWPSNKDRPISGGLFSSLFTRLHHALPLFSTLFSSLLLTPFLPPAIFISLICLPPPPFTLSLSLSDLSLPLPLSSTLLAEPASRWHSWHRENKPTHYFNFLKIKWRTPKMSPASRKY